MRSLALAFAMLGFAGCGEDLPANPTYFEDIQPLLREACGACHGADPVDPKVAAFRLDRYVKDDVSSYDVWDYAQASGGIPAPLQRVAVNREAPAMPPGKALSARDRELLERWLAQGAPKGTRANRLPAIERLAPAELGAVDQELSLSLRAWDDDLDGLIVELWAHELGASGDADDLQVSPRLGAGQRDLTIDTGTLTSKRSYQIYALLDDGYTDDPAQNRTRADVVAEVFVDHGLRGTAPAVRLLTPNGGEALIGSTAITWSASDPDAGDSVTIELALVAVAADGTEISSTAIASGLPNTGSYSWRIPASIPVEDGAGALQRYRLRVTARDQLGQPQNVRSDLSDTTFTIAHPAATTLTWNDVRPVFTTYCGECHGEPARTGPLDYFRLDKYDAGDPVAPVTSDLGVYEVRQLVYQRMIAAGQMPPASSAQPSGADRAKVESWILGGAPRGASSGTRPSFTWLSPSATDATPPAVLQWRATDAEGLRSGRLEYAKVNGNIASGCAGANLGGATWTVIADPKADVMLGGAVRWEDTLSWTPPSTSAGYYCVRGTVTDTEGQATSGVNAYGMR